MSDEIRFLLNGERVDVTGLSPQTTLLEFLRDERRLTGTKEGCAEGDCGACTVVLAEPSEGGVTWKPINACIRLLPSVDGKAVFTVESLASPGGDLHPVQQALVECHGSQCGFCTPGFAMSLFGLYKSAHEPSRRAIDDALSGNLCRCTGYRPIVDAARRMYALTPAGGWRGPGVAKDGSRVVTRDEERLAAALEMLERDRPLEYMNDGARWSAPRDCAGLADACAARPDAQIVAGTTDVALWVTKQHRVLDDMIYLGNVRDLAAIRDTADGLEIGAAVALTEAVVALNRTWPELEEAWQRFASVPIRNSATLAGNIANGSPIGDSMPALMALGARVVLRDRDGEREVDLDAFYPGFRRTARRPGEFVSAVRIPNRPSALALCAYKIGKRYDQDISAVFACFALTIADGRVLDARIGCGGVAPTPVRARRTECALAGSPWDAATVERAQRVLASEFTPIDDLRASAAYRRTVLGNLLVRCFHETVGPMHEGTDMPTRVDSPLPCGTAAMNAREPSWEDAPMVVGTPAPHDSAALHVAGAAPYTDDRPEPRGMLHAAVGVSPCAHGTIERLGLDAVRDAPGVVAVLTAADIPGVNDVGPIQRDDPILAERVVAFAGQPLFAVAATSVNAARRAAGLADVAITPRPALLTIDEALAARSYVLPPVHVTRGDPAAAVAAAPHRLRGRFACGGQDHFYLEGQIALAIPRERGGMQVFTSTQHPGEVQHMVARALRLAEHDVVVECRRMGGGFGGKETQMSLFACVAAVLARKTGRAVKLRLDRDDDMRSTGKRHAFQYAYDVGFDDAGRILGLDVTLASRCGFSADLSGPVNDRAVFHVDNCYWLPHVAIHSYRCKTNTVSDTAFRGFGGPQGMFAIETVLDDIARTLALDPLDVRKANLYGTHERNVTPYGMTVEDNIAPDLIAGVEISARYRERRQAIAAWNRQSPVIKRGIALTPVKFGISFTATHYNQAGALVHVYKDGTVLLNHGGTEMGQGLFVKVQQVVAQELGVTLSQVRVSASDTSKVPNASPTAASSGSDINGMAARAAARTLRERLAALAARQFGCASGDVTFSGGIVRCGGKQVPFAELVDAAYHARIPLSATGFYATPKIHYDRATLSGRPFFYFSYGAAVSEVAIDTLTGEHRLTAVDILHDAGRSLNPAIDRGQIEGGFIQGWGWLTMEELRFGADGVLETHAPSTYKIPTAHDVPWRFAIAFHDVPNREETIYRSKAVGEPPLMLALSGFHALRDAIASIVDYRSAPVLSAPATPERILAAIDDIRGRAQRSTMEAATAPAPQA